MKLVGVEWDEAKNTLNKQEHKLSFEAAQYVFIDPERLERFDRSEGNASGEERL
ncbi:MAG: BrnT family toxin, partial [Treponema sp.]|nr:BrnT family toxin [Treponema sp.]